MEDLYNDDVKAVLEKQEELKQKEVLMPKEQPKTPKTFEEAKDQALAEFKPKYDTSKSMYDNGKDIARTIGLSEALKDDEFLGEVKEGAKKNIRTDMDTDQKDAEIKNQEAFYKKHQPVLEFARMKEPCSLPLMKWVYGFAVIPFMFAMIIGELFNLIKSILDCINTLFNAVLGTPEYLLDEKGNPVKDDKGRFITKQMRVNLLTKIIFWFAFVLLSLVIIFAIVKGITGFDIVQAIKSLIGG